MKRYFRLVMIFTVVASLAALAMSCGKNNDSGSGGGSFFPRVNL